MFFDLKSVKLHGPFFLGGKNFGLDLDPKKVTGLKLQFDPSKDRVIAWYLGSVKGIQNWQDIEPMDPKDFGWSEPTTSLKAAPPVQAAQPNTKIQAQVSTPHGHVFANEPGQTGQSKVK